MYFAIITCTYLVIVYSPIGLLSEVTDVHITQVNNTTVQLSYSSPPTLHFHGC